MIIKIEGLGNKGAGIKKCLKTLYSIREGEQPLDRGLGLDMSFMDQPPDIAKNLIALEILEKTKKYEPRVSVEGVTCMAREGGEMEVTVHAKERGD